MTSDVSRRDEAWERILKKYSESIGVGKEVIIIFKNALNLVSGVIKEIDEDFLFLENKDGTGLTAIVELQSVAGFRTH
jgi:hypothetical protein